MSESESFEGFSFEEPQQLPQRHNTYWERPTAAKNSTPGGVGRDAADGSQRHAVDQLITADHMLSPVFERFANATRELMNAASRAPLIYKCLQKGGDSSLDVLLSTFTVVSRCDLNETCQRLLRWHCSKSSAARSPRLKLAIDFLFCRTIIAVLVHNYELEDGYSEGMLDNAVVQSITELLLSSEEGAGGVLASDVGSSVIVDVSYAGGGGSPHNGNEMMQTPLDDRDLVALTNICAQLLGELARANFQLVTQRYFQHVEQTELSAGRTAMAIGMMAYAPLALFPVEKLKQSMGFLEDCGARLRAAKESKIRNAWAGLLVDVILPIAAVIKLEANMPVCREFVQGLYPAVQDMLKKTKHLPVTLPLNAAVLSLAQRDFFLSKWPGFLSTCLASLKHAKIALQEVAGDCVLRLLWVYTVRLAGESNKSTEAKLKLISDAFFPSNSKHVFPRHVASQFFVRVVSCMAQGHFDFAIKLIISFLGGEHSHNSKNLLNSADRAVIGIRSFLVISNNIENDDTPQPILRVFDHLPSGDSIRAKTELRTKLLTEATTSLNIAPYLATVQGRLVRYLQLLDLQIASVFTQASRHQWHQPGVRSSSGTSTSVSGTSTGGSASMAKDAIPRERSRALDLLKTCIVAVPRCVPLDGRRFDLVGVVFRCTISVDDELCRVAKTALQTLVADRAHLRALLVRHYAIFIVNSIPDTASATFQNALRLLFKLLTQWQRAWAAENADTSAAEDDGEATPSAAPEPESPPREKMAPPPASPPAEPTLSDGIRTSASVPSTPCTDGSPASAAPRSEHRLSRREMRRMGNALHDAGGTEAVLPSPSPDAVLTLVEGVVLAALGSPSDVTHKLCLLLLEHIVKVRATLRVHLPPHTDHVFNVVVAKLSPMLVGMPLGVRATATMLSSQRDLHASSDGESHSDHTGYTVHNAVGCTLDAFTAGADQALDTGSLSFDGTGLVASEEVHAGDVWSARLADLMRTELLTRAPGAVQHSWWCSCQLLAVAAHHAGIDFPTGGAAAPYMQHLASAHLGPDIPPDSPLLAMRAYLALTCAQLPAIAATVVDPIPTATVQMLSDDIGTFRSCSMRMARSVDEFVANLMPLLIDEPVGVQNCVLRAVRWLGPETYLQLSEAMVPLVRDSFSLRSETAKKKRRRDRTRAVMAELHHHTSATAAACLQMAAMPRAVLLQRLGKFITGTRSYLEIESENDQSDLVHLRLHLCMAITVLIENIGDDRVYAELFPNDVRTDLFTLMSQWHDADTARADAPMPDAPRAALRLDGSTPVAGHMASDTARFLPASQDISTTDATQSAPVPCRYGAVLVDRASAAVAALCRGRAFDYAHSITGDAVLLRWIERALRTEAAACGGATDQGARSCAYTAITHLLRDTMDSWVCAWVVAMCLHPAPQTRFTVFSAFSHVVRAQPAVFAEYETQSLCLALLMLADGLPSTQSEARCLLLHVSASMHPSSEARAVHIGASSTVLDTRLQLQRSVSAQLVSALPHLATSVLSTLFSWLMGVTTTPESRLQLCGCLVPWLRAEDLVRRAVPTAVAGGPTVADAILTNLVCLHARFGAADAGVLWRALAGSHGGNLTSAIDLLVCIGNQRGGACIDIAKDVCATLASLELDKVVAVLVDILEAEVCRLATAGGPSLGDVRRGSNDSVARQRSGSYNWGTDAVLAQRSSVASLDDPHAHFFWPPLAELLPVTDGPLPAFNVVLWILEEVNLRCGVHWNERSMTLFLHYACLGMDHPAVSVRQQSTAAIANFLSYVRRSPASVATDVDSDGLEAALANTDLTPTNALSLTATGTGDGAGESSPAGAPAMAQRLCTVFPSLSRVWRAVALDCATSCTTCAYAGRSLAVLRALSGPLGAAGLDDLLVRLSDSAADPDDEIQGYTQEILLTLTALPKLVRAPGPEAPVDTLRATTRLWLTAVALLDSDYDVEFALACDLLLAVCDMGLLSAASSDAPVGVPLLEALAQVNDDAALTAGGRVHRTLCRGLASAATVGPSLAVLQHIARFVGHAALDHPASHGSDGSGRGGLTAALVVAALLVGVLHGFDARTPDAVAAAGAAADVAQTAGATVVARLFRLYHDDKYFRSQELWVKDVCKHFAKHFFPACEVPTLCMLVGAFEMQTDPTAVFALVSTLSALVAFVTLPDSYTMFEARLLPAALQSTAVPPASPLRGGRMTYALASASDDPSADGVQSPTPPAVPGSAGSVDSTRVADMHRLLHAVASACSQQLQQQRGGSGPDAPRRRTPDVDVQLQFVPTWDTPGACQARVRAGLRAALDACGLADESKDKVPRVFVTPRASVGSVLSAGGDDAHGAASGRARGYVSRGGSSEQVVPKSSSDSVHSPSLEVDEKFFEDFDFLDHELDGKNSPVNSPTSLAVPTASGDTASDSDDGAGDDDDDNASLPDDAGSGGRSRAVSLHATSSSSSLNRITSLAIADRDFDSASVGCASSMRPSKPLAKSATLTGSVPALDGNYAAGFDIEGSRGDGDDTHSDLSQGSLSRTVSLPHDVYERRTPPPPAFSLTAENLKSLSRVSLSSSVRSIDDAVEMSPDAMDEQVMHVPLQNAPAQLQAHIAALLNGGAVMSKHTWRLLRQAVRAVLVSHMVFVEHDIRPRMVPSLHAVLDQLHAVAVRMASLILPFVYIDTETLAQANFLENATLLVLELVTAIRVYEEKQVALRNIVDRCVVARQPDVPDVTTAEHIDDTESTQSDIDMDDLVVVAQVPPAPGPKDDASEALATSSPPPPPSQQADAGIPLATTDDNATVAPDASVLDTMPSSLAATPDGPGSLDASAAEPPIPLPAETPRATTDVAPSAAIRATPCDAVPLVAVLDVDAPTEAATPDLPPDTSPVPAADASIAVAPPTVSEEATVPAEGVLVESAVPEAATGFDVAACGEVLATLATMHVQLGTVLATLGNTIDSTLAACAAWSPQAHFSDDFSAALQGIVAAVDEAETVQEKRIDTSGLSKVRAVQYLQDNLARKQTKQSIALLRVFRKAWPQSVFGRTDDDNLDVLATMYAPVLVDGMRQYGIAACAPTIADFRKGIAPTLLDHVVEATKIVARTATSP
eukprot:m.1625096 g.1625096  ORF g.1625096 m.1625096 type:complete len:3077 (-) comp25390_c1_seq3:1823-11053(-)